MCTANAQGKGGIRGKMINNVFDKLNTGSAPSSAVARYGSSSDKTKMLGMNVSPKPLGENQALGGGSLLGSGGGVGSNTGGTAQGATRGGIGGNIKGGRRINPRDLYRDLR